jgi:hypothetical protein
MTIITIFLSIFVIIQLVLFISIINHLKVVLKYLSYQCDTMDRVIADDEAYKEVC